jgi:hypothetical protein
LLPDEEVIAQLVAVKGIGTWTADIFLIFHLNRPDVLRPATWRSAARSSDSTVCPGSHALLRSNGSPSPGAPTSPWPASTSGDG